MIGFLNGIIEIRDDPHIFINVHGIGYKVLVTIDVLSQAIIGQELRVFTYTHVREDILELYGFLKFEDLKLFEKFLGVSGIGPKTAINIFSLGRRSEIIQAITAGNVSFFTAVPRLGKKNAQKLIIELKGKFGSAEELDLSTEELKVHDEVFLALKTFGFSNQEIHDAIRKTSPNAVSTSEKIKLALKHLGK